MNDEMKKLISRFLFCSVIICCFGLLAAGSITASQKSAKTTFDKAYAVMNVRSSKEKLEINMGEKQYNFDFKLSEKLREYEDYIILTPFAGMYYLGKSISEMFDEKENG